MISYHVEAGTTIKEQVKACYAFFTMEWGYLKEATIIGKETPLSDAKTYVDKDVSFEEFWQYYRKCRNGIVCTAAFDPDDKNRIGMMFLPEAAFKDSDIEIKDCLMVNDYANASKKTINAFFECLYEKMHEQ